MQNLGIFGDSFGDPDCNPGGLLKYKAWMYHLPGYHPEIFAQSGSSLYDAYELFLKNHHKQNKNIFLVPNRKRFPNDIVVNKKGQRRGIICFEQAESFLKHELADPATIKKVEILRDIYVHLDTHFLDDFSYLMIKHIKELRPDTIIISCTSEIRDNKIVNSAGDDAKPITYYLYIMLSSIIHKEPFVGYEVGDIYDISKDKYNFLYYYMSFPEKNMICHLSEEMNLILAKDIQVALETGVWNPNPPRYVPHQQDLPFYYNLPRFYKKSWFTNG